MKDWFKNFWCEIFHQNYHRYLEKNGGKHLWSCDKCKIKFKYGDGSNYF